MILKMKCKDCNDLVYCPRNGGSNRYYCKNIIACKEHLCGAVLLSRCDRHSDVLKIKTSPKWCPLKSQKSKEE